MTEPIPFYGWVMIDEESIENMLREQIQIQQREINRLNELATKLQRELLVLGMLTAKRYVYDPDGGDDVWVIEKKKSDEFRG